jgi:hypothetical protein
VRRNKPGVDEVSRADGYGAVAVVSSDRLPSGPGPGRGNPYPEVVAALAAYVCATVVSGLPSTVWALARGDDPLTAVRAAGTLLPGRRRHPSILGGIVVHAAVSAFWTAALALAARRWPLTPVRGALAGLGIAALDLGVIGRRYPAIAALHTPAQLADHAMFGAIVGHLLARADRRQAGGAGSFEGPAPPFGGQLSLIRLRIKHIWAMRHPEKLRPWTTG